MGLIAKTLKNNQDVYGKVYVSCVMEMIRIRIEKPNRLYNYQQDIQVSRFTLKISISDSGN